MNQITHRITAVALAFALVLFAGLSTASADERIKPSMMQRVTHGLNPMNWRLPDWKMPKFSRMLPAEKEKTPVNRKQPNRLIEGFTETASKGWDKTKQGAGKLNPMNYLPASTKKPKPASNKPGFFRSMFQSEPEPRSSETVTDFLRQERPGI